MYLGVRGCIWELESVYGVRGCTLEVRECNLGVREFI